MRKKSAKDSIIDRAADLFDLPGEIVGGMARVTVTGCKRVFIESHKGVLEYESERISINGGRSIIHIRGDNLGIKYMNSTDMLVTGTVFGIDFEL